MKEFFNYVIIIIRKLIDIVKAINQKINNHKYGLNDEIDYYNSQLPSCNKKERDIIDMTEKHTTENRILLIAVILIVLIILFS